MNKSEQNSLISVILPVKNAESTITNSVNSILAQTYRNFELIILNDGSQDNTHNIIKSFGDDRIVYHYSESQGLVFQLNKGLLLAKGKYIARMDADDTCSARRFEEQIEYIENYPVYDLIGTNYYEVTSSNVVEKILPRMHDDIEFQMPVFQSICHPSILCKRDILIKLGGYNQKLKYAEDHDLFLRMLAFGAKMYNIQEPLYNYYIGSNSYYNRNKQNHIKQHYINGYNYIQNYLNKSPYKKYKLALLEYYFGDVDKARNLFFECLIDRKIRRKYVIRYLITSILGNSIIKSMRRQGISSRISGFLSEKFGINTQLYIKSDSLRYR